MKEVTKMVFSSPLFLYLFFPGVFLLDHLLRWVFGKNAAKASNTLLAVSSLVFYAFGQMRYVPLFIASILLNYFSGLVLIAAPARWRRFWLTVSLLLNLTILGFYKYAGFLSAGLSHLFRLSIPIVSPTLPIGISFYTFQGMSYVIDVYRNPKEGTGSLAKLFLYIAFFPQLIAGPIVKYHDIAREIDCRHTTLEDVADGIIRFSRGLAKKVLIANTVGRIADAVFTGIAMGSSAYAHPLLAWIGAATYMLQIYYDFSGYSDMAIGMGRIFGFHFQENFDFPYTSFGIREFWRRWHISLSAWFKEYLYIPLGGNRKGQARTWLNRFLVFLCTGIWHGANWTFLIWGLCHGALSSLEGTGLIPIQRMRKTLPGRLGCRLYTLLAVMLLFVLFRADSVTDALRFYRAMFAFFSGGLSQEVRLTMALLLTPESLVIAAVGICFSQNPLKRYACSSGTAEKALPVLRPFLALLLLLLSILHLAGSGYDPFIYFQF